MCHTVDVRGKRSPRGTYDACEPDNSGMDAKDLLHDCVEIGKTTREWPI